MDAAPPCHWDEVEIIAIDRGELRGERWRLGAAAGAQRVGATRYRLPPRTRAMPVHVHADEEEIFFVLAGSGLSWQDGHTFAVGPGDCLVHLINGAAHTMIAGDDGLDVLAFAGGSETRLTWLPRAGAWWAGPRWLPHDGPSPFAAEVAAGPLEVPAPEAQRPPTIVALADVEAGPFGRGGVSSERRDLGRAAGSRRSGLQHVSVAAGALNAPPHCHSAEEELFVVLDGDGALLLGEHEHPVRAGHVVARPPGTGVAHAFRAGADGLTLLAYGQRDPNDMTFFPRSQKVALRGLGVRFRVEMLEYWDGEE